MKKGVLANGLSIHVKPESNGLSITLLCRGKNCINDHTMRIKGTSLSANGMSLHSSPLRGFRDNIGDVLGQN